MRSLYGILLRMSHGIWPEWMIYHPPSSPDLGTRTGRGNVIRDVAREVLSAISGLTLLGPQEGVIWRGQASCWWRLESRMGRLGMSADEMVTQECAMLSETREIGIENAQHLGDWEILARLRHHGAATRLIDFTTDPLVALWFLCDDSSRTQNEGSVREEQGVLLAIRRSGIGELKAPYEPNNYLQTLKEGGNLLYKTPPIDPRIAAQRGIFALSTSPLARSQCQPSELDLPTPNPYWLRDPSARLAKICDVQKWANRRGSPIRVFPTTVGIAIPALVKESLLSVLKTSYGFTQASMFPDFAGMGQVYSGRHP